MAVFSSILLYLRHVSPLPILSAQAGEREHIAFKLIARAAEKDPIRYVIDPAVRARGVVIQLKIRLIVKYPIAALALGSVLFQQILVHLRP